MTLERSCSWAAATTGNALRLLLGEVQREHGQAAADALIRELDLEQAFGLKPGTDFAGVGR
jgi:hypothetical protein